ALKWKEGVGQRRGCEGRLPNESPSALSPTRLLVPSSARPNLEWRHIPNINLDRTRPVRRPPDLGMTGKEVFVSGEVSAPRGAPPELKLSADRRSPDRQSLIGRARLDPAAEERRDQ